ncbi:Spy/CpxP family protein refolding chaperone [Sulfurihydrogenibium sp.]|uniref:Spy/CpxP family protein refolding chaperone n=1 Tax=Sulfurihydrogenibium sp. TaxID=2053621 RepID=UPI00261118C3|nr:Spy/CpxP family protein refolding chaperone [Sulfurihydrogenibium sp.]
MKKLMVAVLTVASLTFTSTYAMMEDSPMHQKMEQKQEKHLEKLKKELNLTDQQVQQWKEIKKAENEEMRNLMKEHKNPFLEATKSGNFDKEVFKNTVLENAKRMSEIKAKYMEKLFSILNDEQKKKFIQIMKEKFDKMHERMQKEF